MNEDTRAVVVGNRIIVTKPVTDIRFTLDEGEHMKNLSETVDGYYTQENSLEAIKQKFEYAGRVIEIKGVKHREVSADMSVEEFFRITDTNPHWLERG